MTASYLMKFTLLSSEKHRPKRQAIMVALTSQTPGTGVPYERLVASSSGCLRLLVEWFWNVILKSVTMNTLYLNASRIDKLHGLP